MTSRLPGRLVGLFLLWVLLVDSLNVAEVVAGVAMTLIAAGVAALARRDEPPLLPPPWPSRRELLALPVRAVVDVGRLTAALTASLRGRRPRFATREIQAPRARGRLAGQRAAAAGLTAWVGSLPAGSVVIDVDPVERSMRVHRLERP